MLDVRYRDEPPNQLGEAQRARQQCLDIGSCSRSLAILRLEGNLAFQGLGAVTYGFMRTCAGRASHSSGVGAYPRSEKAQPTCCVAVSALKDRGRCERTQLPIRGAVAVLRRVDRPTRCRRTSRRRARRLCRNGDAIQHFWERKCSERRPTRTPCGRTIFGQGSPCRRR